MKELQVMTDRRLREPDGPGHVTDACLAVGLRGDEAQEPEADGIGQRLERAGEILGVALTERGV
jgi:hypothetical protein